MLMPHEIDALIGRAQLAGDVLNYTVEITSDPPAAFEAPPNVYFFLAKLLDVHGREARARISTSARAMTALVRMMRYAPSSPLFVGWTSGQREEQEWKRLLESLLLQLPSAPQVAACSTPSCATNFVLTPCVPSGSVAPLS